MWNARRPAHRETSPPTRRPDLLFLLRRLSGEVCGRASEIHQPLAKADVQRSGRCDLYVPHASANSAGRSWLVPNLWHGARTSACDGRSRTECRVDRHEPPILDRPCSLASGRSPGDGRTFDRSTALPKSIHVELDPNDSWPPLLCFGVGGRFSCAAGSPCLLAI